QLLPHLLYGADQAPGPPLLEREPIEHARWHLAAEALEPPAQVALVLSHQGVEPDSAGDGTRITSDPLTRPLEDVDPLAVGGRCEGPAQVPAVGVTGDELEHPIAAAPDPHRRPTSLNRGREARRRARFAPPDNPYGVDGRGQLLQSPAGALEG